MHALHEDQVIALPDLQQGAMHEPEPVEQCLAGEASLEQQGVAREGALRFRMLPALVGKLPLPQVEDVTPQSPPPQPKDEPPCFVEVKGSMGLLLQEAPEVTPRPSEADEHTPRPPSEQMLSPCSGNGEVTPQAHSPYQGSHMSTGEEATPKQEYLTPETLQPEVHGMHGSDIEEAEWQQGSPSHRQLDNQRALLDSDSDTDPEMPELVPWTPPATRRGSVEDEWARLEKEAVTFGSSEGDEDSDCDLPEGGGGMAKGFDACWGSGALRVALKGLREAPVDPH
mmetsp:Transcript_6171/g.10743  ORF Transcript_6171/g.10743 Transcript_6171/m.10743 type:complete len:283 (-) Transcript_6171:101-949(-)